MKALAVLNVLGWLVAVPLLLVALVDPFVDFGGWPERLIGGRQGDVQLHPATSAPREGARTPAARTRPADDPLRAAREALRRFRPATGIAPASGGALVPASPGASGGGGDTRGRGGSLRGVAGPGRTNGPALRPIGQTETPTAGGVQPAPAGPVVLAPGAGADSAGTPPPVAPEVPQAPIRPARVTEPPPPETPVEAAPPGDPDGPGPGPTPTPTPEPTPEPAATPTVTPQPSATPAPEPTATPDPPAPEVPVPPEDPPGEPEDPPDPPQDHANIPPAVKPPQDQMPAPDLPGAPGPPPS